MNTPINYKRLRSISKKLIEAASKLQSGAYAPDPRAVFAAYGEIITYTNIIRALLAERDVSDEVTPTEMLEGMRVRIVGGPWTGHRGVVTKLPWATPGLAMVALERLSPSQHGYGPGTVHTWTTYAIERFYLEPYDPKPAPQPATEDAPE